MIVYFAGMNRAARSFETAVAAGCKHIMVSFYHGVTPFELRRFRRHGVHVFLDSGAYSAWRKGTQVELDDYTKFIRASLIEKYVVLDVVGDPEQTAYNQARMESMGFEPVPVFHLGSDLRYLRQLRDDGHRYVALGGTVGSSRQVREQFFDQCFAEFPELYFHGLGMTDPRLMLKYPWFSVDSTTWLAGRKYGRLVTEDGRKVELPKDMATSEKIAVNVRLFSEIERKTEGGIE